VPTTSGTAPARFSTNSTSSATAQAASRRRSIGVVPAWLAWPDHLAQVTAAAVDAGDHTQRQVQLVEHRALFDVDLDEAQVARSGSRRSAWMACSVPAGRRRASHPQAHAVGVLLVQPGRIESCR
jgi:hypothetical protein